jgi:multidrug efflux pump subunit AcrA (membrane-fusion protein)
MIIGTDMKKKLRWLILAGGALVVIFVFAFGLNHSTQAQHFTAKVESGDIDDVVEATGTINPIVMNAEIVQVV